jgi:rubrerythrin
MAFVQAADIVELAMRVEQSGEVFYRAVVQKATSPTVRDLFEDLAAQEVIHYKIFSKLSQAVQNNPWMTDAEWDEYAGYLQATVQSAFFDGPDKALALAETVADEAEALNMAIGFEKETLLFFYDLRDTVTAADRSFIEKIIAEEKKHIRRLVAKLKVVPE